MRRPRLRPLRLVALLVAITVVELAAVGYLHARDTLDHRRGELADTRATLAATRGELADTRDGERSTRRSSTEVRAGIDALAEARALIMGHTGDVHAEKGQVDLSRHEVDFARFVVGAEAGETRACFDGVAQAIAANRRGDGSTAVDALRDVSGLCSRTLAATTGARFPYDFADPFVLRANDRYYGYSTNAGAGDIQVITSTDLDSWELVGNALAGLPPWATPGATWAPAVLDRGGHYVVYYSAREAASGLQCISHAVSSWPTGPFVDRSTAPLVCQRNEGGSIDATPFVDADGRVHLIWKSEGKGSYGPLIWSQELRAAGLALIGTPQVMLSLDRPFEQGVIEAPSLVRDGGRYLLLYAGGRWGDRSYVTAYATCVGPRGPCTKPADGRILRSGERLAGPGGAEVFHDSSGAPWIAFHAFSEPAVGYPSSRYLYVARLRLTGGTPVVDTDT